MVSIRRSARLICYQGDVCDFLNQLQTSITAKTNAQRAYKGLTAAFSNVTSNTLAFAA